MGIGDRIKVIRERKNLNQRDFASSIKISQPALAMFENGQRELKDIHIEQICSKYNVNETWLRTGEGEMFLKLQTNSLVASAAQLLGKKDPLLETFLETYSTLSPESREIIMNYLLDFAKTLSSKVNPE